MLRGRKNNKNLIVVMIVGKGRIGKF